MNNIKNGGSAFPCRQGEWNSATESFESDDPGMSLRDFFAAKVAPEIVRVMGFRSLEEDQALSHATAHEWLKDVKAKAVFVADISGIIADAMVAEREKAMITHPSIPSQEGNSKVEDKLPWED